MRFGKTLAKRKDALFPSLPIMASSANQLLPIHQLVAKISPALGDQILAFVQENERDVFVSTMTVACQLMKFRPQVWKTWPKQKQREWLWGLLHQGRFADTAQQLLQEWFFGQRAEMMTRFLEAMDIAHSKEGYVEGEIPEKLDEKKLQAAVDGLLKDFAAEEIALYLHLFQRGQEHGWAEISALLESDARLKL